MKAYELTAISCLTSFTAERTREDAGGITFKAVNESATFIVRSRGSADRRLVHRNGAASDIVIRRLGAPPPQCAAPPADTPLNNFDVFARTWAEQYGFFDLRKANWRAITARYRTRASATPRPQMSSFKFSERWSSRSKTRR
jgi:hypothetical protein